MFRIDKGKNEITALDKKSFSELGFKERNDLQEWIAQEPSCLGEDLLIIQKEFAGFADTKERLDLLALDKDGSLVIIENKLDDSGRDVTWQALKYASYCSEISKEKIRKIYQEFLDGDRPGEKAEENLKAFFGVQNYEDIQINKGTSQRIILIAANFRKEVTATVLWLMNFSLRLQCFKVTPYSMGDAMDEKLFLTFEQIIPTKDAEEYTIGLAEKAREEAQQELTKAERHRIGFWKELLPVMNKKTTLFQDINPRKESSIFVTSSVSNVRLSFYVTKKCGRVELYIDRGDKDQNKYIFDWLHDHRKEQIEKDFGDELEWERRDEGQASRIKSETDGDVSDEQQWDDMINFMIDAMIRMEKAFKKPLAELKEKIEKEFSNQT